MYLLTIRKNQPPIFVLTKSL